MTVTSFPILSFEQANPLLAGLKYGQGLIGQFYQNQAAGIQNKYLPDMTQAQLAELRARPGLMNSQANYYGSEAAKNDFMVNHPAYMAGGVMAQLAALENILKNNPDFLKTPTNSPAPIQQPQPQPQMAPQQGAPSWMSQLQPQLNTQQAPLPGLGGGQMPPQLQPALADQVQGGQSSPAPTQAAPLPGFGGAGGQPTDIKSSLIDSILAPIRLADAKARLYNQKATGSTYLNATPDTKRYATAQATAFGYSPDEAVKNFMSGKSVADLADEKGYGRDPAKWPVPDYNPTIASLSRSQQRQTAVSELNAVEPFINNALGQYSQTIHGYSPQQVLDSFNSLNANTPEGKAKKDKLSDFLAATIVVPEYNAIRARAMGVQNIGVEAMRNIGDASMNNFKKFQGLVPPDVYMAAQTKANQLIRQMNSAANKASLVPYQPAQNQGMAAPAASPLQSDMVRIQAPNGQILRVPAANADALLRDHPDHKRIS